MWFAGCVPMVQSVVYTQGPRLRISEPRVLEKAPCLTPPTSLGLGSERPQERSPLPKVPQHIQGQSRSPGPAASQVSRLTLKELPSARTWGWGALPMPCSQPRSTPTGS